MTNRSVLLALSPDEALVLFEMLARLRYTVGTHIGVEDRAELAVLWTLQNTLEAQLLAPLEESYLRQVADAKLRLDPGEID